MLHCYAPRRGNFTQPRATPWVNMCPHISAPCKGNCIMFHYVVSLSTPLSCMYLPLQGAELFFVRFPRALPWAMFICPFRAVYAAWWHSVVALWAMFICPFRAVCPAWEHSVAALMAMCICPFRAVYAAWWHSVVTLMAMCISPFRAVCPAWWHSIAALWAMFICPFRAVYAAWWHSVAALWAMCNGSFRAARSARGLCCCLPWTIIPVRRR